MFALIRQANKKFSKFTKREFMQQKTGKRNWKLLIKLESPIVLQVLKFSGTNFGLTKVIDLLIPETISN